MCAAGPEIIAVLNTTLPDLEGFAAWFSELAGEFQELAQAKTGQAVEFDRSEDEHGVTLRPRLVGGRAFGLPPAWCRKRIDSADPMKLSMRLSCANEAPFYAKAEIFVEVST